MVSEEGYVDNNVNESSVGFEMEINEFRRRGPDHEKFVQVMIEHTGEITTKRNKGQIVIHKLSALSKLPIKRTKELFEELQRMFN